MSDPIEPEAPPGPLLRLIKDKRVAFLIVGAVNTVIGFLWYTLFLWLLQALPAGYMIALVAAQIVSVLCAFVLYRRFVFRVRGHVWRDLIRFSSVYAVSFGINLLVLPALVELLGWHPLWAQVVIVVVTTIVSYIGHNYFSFHRRTEES
ncbi:GtrA family protein [Microbacterium sp. CFH 90308]|uniref:GtrA family protein n=1 Tax=Microbacterium salsuginis TaxID=2722803 RepID=A0ABX1KEV2_9MICO|nr:GtrA family protein [Microbacterium sp. CFH 90308]NLP83916.1 GtrA family protein [Microbacterium sp. CFH 90308]